ncbi:hypothetical protein C9374_006311 [Naegleria lovaniensis]|uniref:Uncharacterized protein n=1 Tax=Naegleria lovaniensis TaxID=51637 RepID=A0AA88GN27_NAELO|nr:uncharacterized protein C9374_006311 [Naegleria lovaniensis]KAG2381322.1 hypothetical protein C9374_006311 [Naegleria lovaniensis]
MKKNASNKRVSDGPQSASSQPKAAPSSSSVMGNDPYSMMKKSGSFNVKGGMNASLFGSIFQKVNTALDSNIAKENTATQKTQAELSSKQEYSFPQHAFNERIPISKNQTIEETVDESSSDEEDDSMDRIKTLDEFEDFSGSDKEDYSPNVVIVNNTNLKSQFGQPIVTNRPNNNYTNSVASNNNPSKNSSPSTVSKPETNSQVIHNKNLSSNSKQQQQTSSTYHAPLATSSSIHDLEDVEFSDYEDHVSHSAQDEDDSVVIEEEEIVEPEKSSIIEEVSMHEHQEDEEFSDFEAPHEDSFNEEFEDFQGSDNESLDDFNPDEYDDFESEDTVPAAAKPISSNVSSSKIISIPTLSQQQITQPVPQMVTTSKSITNNIEVKHEPKKEDLPPSTTAIITNVKQVPLLSVESSLKQETQMNIETQKTTPPALNKQASTIDVRQATLLTEVKSPKLQEVVSNKDTSPKESSKEVAKSLHEKSTETIQPKPTVVNDKANSQLPVQQTEPLVMELPSSRSVCIGTDLHQKAAKSSETTTQTDSSLFRTQTLPPTDSTLPFQQPPPQPHMYSPYFVPYSYQYYYPPPVHVFRQPQFADVYAKRFDLSHHPFNSYQSAMNLTKLSAEQVSQPLKQDSTALFHSPNANTNNTNKIPKEILKPYVPQTKEIFQRSEKVDQQYKTLRNSLSSYVESNHVGKSHVREQHERNSYNIRRELDEIKHILKSTKEDLSHLLYSSNTRPHFESGSSNNMTPSSPFDVNNHPSCSHEHRPRGYTTLEKTKAFMHQCNPYATINSNNPFHNSHPQQENPSVVQ